MNQSHYTAIVFASKNEKNTKKNIFELQIYDDKIRVLFVIELFAVLEVFFFKTNNYDVRIYINSSNFRISNSLNG